MENIKRGNFQIDASDNYKGPATLDIEFDAGDGYTGAYGLISLTIDEVRGLLVTLEAIEEEKARS